MRPKPHNQWHLDEMVVSIGGQRMYMWRAVDSEGEVLDVLVQRRRDKAAALKLLRKLLKKQGFAPAVIVTDKLRSYGAALRTIGFSVSMSRACAPITERRIRISPFDDVSAKCEASDHPNQLSALFRSTPPSNPFNVQRHLICRATHRQFRAEAHNVWSDTTVAVAKIREATMMLPREPSVLTCQCLSPPIAAAGQS